jgi:hypothetical protein
MLRESENDPLYKLNKDPSTKNEYIYEKQHETEAFERHLDEIMKKYWETLTATYDFKANPYMFPIGIPGSPTTTYPTYLRYGFVPSLSVINYTSMEEIQLNQIDPSVEREDIIKELGKKKHYMGQGKNLMMDRIYIRNKLAEFGKQING